MAEPAPRTIPAVLDRVAAATFADHDALRHATTAR